MANKVDLTQADAGVEYQVAEIITEDTEMKDFLFTLGCFQGEHITLMSILSGLYVVSIKDARYSVSKDLAQSIIIDKA